LTGGTTYKFKLAAVNKYDTGALSSELEIMAAQEPDTPNAPTTTQESIYIKIEWAAPFDNYEAIDYYKIEILDTNSNFVEDSSCDGTSSTVISNLYCLIPMTSLWDEPFLLTQGTRLQAKISAHNSRGWSAESSINTAGAEIEVVPLVMSAPTRGTATSNLQIQIDWETIVDPADGGSSVLGYALYTDDATTPQTWSELTGYSSLYQQTTFTMTTESGGAVLQEGQTYYFKVAAKNKWGWGSGSLAGSILAATTPTQVLNVATSIDSGTGGVIITWSEPAELGGISLDSYTIELQGLDDNSADSYTTWRTESTCDGSETTIRDARTCTVPMATLSSPDHSLPFDALIYVRIYGTNTLGDGPLSDVNTDGARIR
jgi:hypothetical protein